MDLDFENYFDPDSWIMSTLSRMADLMIANILWILTSLPVITIGASTAALYTVVKTPGRKRYASSVVKVYFKAFRQNFVKATLVFLILLALTALILVNLYLLICGMASDSPVPYVVCAIPVFLLLFAWSYALPLTATFENSVFRNIINSFALSVAHLPTTVLLTLLNLLPAAVFLFFSEFFFKTLIFWCLLAFALIAKADSLLLERVFRRYADLPGKDE